MQVLAAEIEGSGIGRFHRWVDFTGPTRPVTHGLHHPMGGTRMHDDPKVGVVDRDCKVHGVPNLYLAGSSVFTTGLGYANPTLTIAALSTRLAEHLQMVVGAVKTGGWTAYRTREL
jgi:choline dehydrogenase-like flavoprotein